MKITSYLPMFILPLLLSACMLAGGKSPDGSEWKVGTLGTDADDFNVNPEGLHVIKLNQSRGLKIVADTVNKMWANYLIAEGLMYVADKYYTLEGAKVSAATTVQLEELRNAKSAADAAAALKVLQAAP